MGCVLNDVAQSSMEDMIQNGFVDGFFHYDGILLVLRLSK
jgi:hypothetical protein